MQTAMQEKTETVTQSTAGAEHQLVPLERVARPQRVVESQVPVLDTGMFDHMTRIAKLMASSSLVPTHLNAVRKVSGRDVQIEAGEAIANCFLVVNQAVRWRMDPFAVAQHTFVQNGKIGYEGKLVAAVINTHPMVVKRLSYRYEGNVGKADRKVIVTARTAGDEEDRTVEGTVAQWQTKDKDGNIKAAWTGNADQQLAYRGAREWARRWLPEAILGVWADDELDQFTTHESTARAEPLQRGAAGLKQALSKDTVPQGGSAKAGAAPEGGGDNGFGSGPAPASTVSPEDPDKPLTIIDHIAKLAGLNNLEEIATYADSMPEEMLQDPRWTEASQKRLAEINGQGA